MTKWIALTEYQCEIIAALLKSNEESLVDMLHFSMNNTDQENAEFEQELIATLNALEKIQHA